jgi:hypothetical protein
MRSLKLKALVTCLLCTLFLIPSTFAYDPGDTTDDWSMWEGWQEINYRLYDYQGKLVLVNLWKDT